MSTLVEYKCPNCNERTSIWLGEGHYPPFFRCGCGQPITKKCGVTEWQLRSKFSKIIYLLFNVSFRTILLGFGLPILPLSIYIILTQDYPKEDAVYLCFIALVPVGVIIGYIWSVREVRKDIKLSNKRMEDERYRNELKALGFLKE